MGTHLLQFFFFFFFDFITDGLGGWIISILPALAFSLDMFDKTHQSYGVNEVLLASVLGAVVFSLFAAQPLVIVGVTGMSKGNKRVMSANANIYSQVP